MLDMIFACLVTDSKDLAKALILAESIGLPIKHSKTVLPSTKVELHGILVDTEW